MRFNTGLKGEKSSRKSNGWTKSW